MYKIFNFKSTTKLSHDVIMNCHSLTNFNLIKLQEWIYFRVFATAQRISLAALGILKLQSWPLKFCWRIKSYVTVCNVKTAFLKVLSAVYKSTYFVFDFTS